MTKMVPIEKGMARPKDNRRRNNLKYPWAEMDKDDSFVIVNGSLAACYAQVAAANQTYAPRRFTASKIGDKSVRVWRLY